MSESLKRSKILDRKAQSAKHGKKKLGEANNIGLVMMHSSRRGVEVHSDLK